MTLSEIAQSICRLWSCTRVRWKESMPMYVLGFNTTITYQIWQSNDVDGWVNVSTLFVTLMNMHQRLNRIRSILLTIWTFKKMWRWKFLFNSQIVSTFTNVELISTIDCSGQPLDNTLVIYISAFYMTQMKYTKVSNMYIHSM